MIAAPIFTPTDTSIVPEIGESDDFVRSKTNGTRDPAPGATSGVRQADDRRALPGLSQLYWFERDIDQKIERYKRDGKDPHDLFDPSKTDYLGTPEALLPYFGTGLSAAAAKSHALQIAQFNTSTDMTRRTDQ